MSGTYSVSFSLRSTVHNDHNNDVHLYKNMEQIPETWFHTTFNGNGLGDGWVVSNGGRTVYLSAEKGDTIHLGMERNGGTIWGIMTCINFVSI